jgi:hypothetical protein
MVNTPATPAPRSTIATWGLVCGIVGVVGVLPFVPLLEYVFAPAAIVLGVLGFREVSRGMRGRGMCIAAIALGVLALAVAITRMVAAS